MENCEDIKDIRKALQSFQTTNEVYLELGKQKERVCYLEKALENANCEIQNRDALIEKILKDNESLDRKVKRFKSVSFSPLADSNEKNNHTVSSLETEIKRLNDIVSEREQNLKVCYNNMKDMCNQFQELEKENACLEKQLEESKECVLLLEDELTCLREDFENVCKKIQERTKEMKKLAIEYERYNQRVKTTSEQIINGSFSSESMNTCNVKNRWHSLAGNSRKSGVKAENLIDSLENTNTALYDSKSNLKNFPRCTKSSSAQDFHCNFNQKRKNILNAQSKPANLYSNKYEVKESRGSLNKYQTHNWSDDRSLGYDNDGSCDHEKINTKAKDSQWKSEWDLHNEDKMTIYISKHNRRDKAERCRKAGGEVVGPLTRKDKNYINSRQNGKKKLKLIPF